MAGFFSRFTLCDLEISARSTFVPAGASTEVPAGCYARTNRDFTGEEPIASVDLVTSSNTPPGVYVLEYRDASPGSYRVGTLNLTVEENHDAVIADLYVFSKSEIFMVNQPVSFYGCLSSSPKDDSKAAMCAPSTSPSA